MCPTAISGTEEASWEDTWSEKLFVEPFKWFSLNLTRAVAQLCHVQLSERWIIFHTVDRATELPEEGRAMSLRTGFEFRSCKADQRASSRFLHGTVLALEQWSAAGKLCRQIVPMDSHGFQELGLWCSLTWTGKCGSHLVLFPACASCLPMAFGEIRLKHQWSASFRVLENSQPWLCRECKPKFTRPAHLLLVFKVDHVEKDGSPRSCHELGRSGCGLVCQGKWAEYVSAFCDPRTECCCVLPTELVNPGFQLTFIQNGEPLGLQHCMCFVKHSEIIGWKMLHKWKHILWVSLDCFVGC